MLRYLMLVVGSFLFLNAYAAYQAPSIVVPIKPGDRIENLYPQQLSQPFIVQRLTENTYWASVHGYNSTFYVGQKGVLLIDPLGEGDAQGLLDAIKTVTQLPITALVYSHDHLDHIGDAQTIVNSNKTMKIYASKACAEHIKRYDKVLPPTDIISTPSGKFTFEDIEVEMQTPTQGHTDDDSIIYIPSESVVHYVDMINPDQMPYLSFAGVQDFNAYQDNLRHLLTLDWKLMNAGHGNIGTKDDVTFVLNYIDELKSAIKGTFGVIKSFTYQDPKYNHQRASQRYIAAVVAAIQPEFEKKYGKMYGFKEAFPIQVAIVLSYLSLYGQ